MLGLGAQIDLDISQRFSARQLRKGQRKELIQARKVLHLVLRTVPSHHPRKGCQGQVQHDLRKDEFACVHGNPWALRVDKDRSSQKQSSNRQQSKASISLDKSVTYINIT